MPLLYFLRHVLPHKGYIWWTDGPEAVRGALCCATVWEHLPSAKAL